MSKKIIKELIKLSSVPEKQKEIADKVLHYKRITPEEGVYLYEKAELSYLGLLANYIREKRHGNNTYFNKNFHIEPTNICVYSCTFCSYSRKFSDNDTWEFDLEDIVELTEKYKNTDVTEVHIVGGVHPYHDVYYYGKILKKIKKILPHIHIKAFTAVELEFMFRKSKMTIKDGLKKLQNYGLDSIPGGGAEIFDKEIRKQVCHEKSKSRTWLEIHKTAHQLGIRSNATMLYGHIENYTHRINHLEKLRELQDQTKGFQTFIPLKYRNKNNKLSYLEETSVIDDLKNYAISRIYLDNFDHIKAYWVMLGVDTAQMSLNYGVNDLDGTIDDSTKIYSMAGNKQIASMTTDDIIAIIKQVKRKPIERDTLYNRIIKS